MQEEVVRVQWVLELEILLQHRQQVVYCCDGFSVSKIKSIKILSLQGMEKLSSKNFCVTINYWSLLTLLACCWPAPRTGFSPPLLICEADP